MRSADAAVGFRLFNGTIVTFIATPWFMTVVSQADDLMQKAFEPRLPLNLPEGNIEFALSEVEALGRIATYSLFSMMFDFANMISVLATAEAALPALMLPANAEEVVHRHEPGVTFSL
ncbi:[NiFe]-hydrogenase assembly chaperone HybE [Bradyrhizobium sp. CCGUVB1N3]|uniref:[NiFe]-hydrogenase assembly chaperone HybE n=1 Tax=Bradyrhizobium sp. CCGUVB1N3 TaxID=2949629 RepID=UPI0020B27393|nr:[NiFe]-hydrogenase assembly chaperone HybE [Bradyrhizobium sp. CCGUVB1N3]MCP3476024.1 [NiFe]-hydrogenase assembly chaperone HybE [Bradyrhizobium sp. CCGUVB1N3]